MKPVKVVLLGAGLRGQIYTEYANSHPERMQVVAVAEPNEERRRKILVRHGLDEKRGYADWKELLDAITEGGAELKNGAGRAAGSSNKLYADAAIICTQDKMHYEPAMAAMGAGLHVLLEKPMSTYPEECIRMGNMAASSGKLFAICHVLRYTPFFSTLKQLLQEGRIGNVVSIVHNENVGYWHQAHSFVRGNWRKASESSPMILAKSCHDLDILLWLAGADCTKVSSFGSLSHFRKDEAPAGAPKRCLDGCPVADNCPYYAPRLYLTSDTDWPTSAISDDPSYEARRRALETGPYGRCVYHCDNDVVDHQVVNLEFEGGITAAFTMSAFTNEIGRTIKIMGTRGEIRGSMEKDEIEITLFGSGRTETITLKSPGGHEGHGGGDEGLMRDFCRLVAGGSAEGARTGAYHSVQSHLMAFAAERSRLEGRVVSMSE
ncbi:Gfo/Idh/MocA family protein [Paenibacillus sp. GCM10023252]|uniref:Gfo/Idh/MocA family protein n=1 Tax=Paenibacillus sp. GCM10023252 TaxID=3252649 RepID=UPI00361F1314